MVAAVFRRLRAFPVRGYAGAALTAVLTGIVVNALTLQHERHPAPFFAPRAIGIAPPNPAATASPPPAPAAAFKPEDSATVPVLPPQRPISLTAGDNPTPPARHVDAIGDILREDVAKGSQKEILAAQTDLIKLGYSLHADGVANTATQTALREFERAHSLPVSTEVTPRLLKHLAAAVAGR